MIRSPSFGLLDHQGAQNFLRRDQLALPTSTDGVNVDEGPAGPDNCPTSATKLAGPMLPPIGALLPQRDSRLTNAHGALDQHITLPGAISFLFSRWVNSASTGRQ